MAGPGDSLLLRAGLVRADQLAEAQQLRARGGGTTGEWLVRLGAVTEEQLVDFYHRRLLVPRILSPQLARVPPQVLLAVPPEMASEFLVFPVGIDAQGALTLAMADPADTHVAEEVAFYSGRACHRTVAPASAIREAIEKSYRPRTQPAPGKHRDLRAVPITHEPEGGVPDERRRASGTAPLRLTLSAPDAARPPAEEPQLLTRPKSDPALPAPVTLPPALAAEATVAGRQRSITQSRMAIPARSGAPAPLARGHEPPTPLKTVAAGESTRKRTLPGLVVVPELPVAALRAAANRDEIASVLVGYSAQLAPIAALLVIKRGALVGHDARAPHLNVERFQSLAIPLDEPSLFRDVVQTLLPFRGTLPDAPAHRAIVGTLGRLPGEVLLLPISVGGKAIAVLYAAGIGAPLPEPALRALAEEAGSAYERLIRSRRS